MRISAIGAVGSTPSIYYVSAISSVGRRKPVAAATRPVLTMPKDILENRHGEFTYTCILNRDYDDETDAGDAFNYGIGMVEMVLIDLRADPDLIASLRRLHDRREAKQLKLCDRAGRGYRLRVYYERRPKADEADWHTLWTPHQLARRLEEFDGAPADRQRQFASAFDVAAVDYLAREWPVDFAAAWDAIGFWLEHREMCWLEPKDDGSVRMDIADELAVPEPILACYQHLIDCQERYAGLIGHLRQ